MFWVVSITYNPSLGFQFAFAPFLLYIVKNPITDVDNWSGVTSYACKRVTTTVVGGQDIIVGINDVWTISVENIYFFLYENK